MAKKKFGDQDIDDVHGPMNQVAKEDAKAWAKEKNWSSRYSPEQLRRIEVAKMKKEKNSTKKQDRRNNKQILKNYKEE